MYCPSVVNTAYVTFYSSTVISCKHCTYVTFYPSTTCTPSAARSVPGPARPGPQRRGTDTGARARRGSADAGPCSARAGGGAAPLPLHWGAGRACSDMAPFVVAGSHLVLSEGVMKICVERGRDENLRKKRGRCMNQGGERQLSGVACVCCSFMTASWTRTGVTNDLSAFDAGAAAAAVAVTPPALDAWDGRRHAAIFRCYFSKTRRHKSFNT